MSQEIRSEMNESWRSFPYESTLKETLTLQMLEIAGSVG